MLQMQKQLTHRYGFKNDLYKTKSLCFSRNTISIFPPEPLFSEPHRGTQCEPFHHWPKPSVTKDTSIACLFRLGYWFWQTTHSTQVIQHNSPVPELHISTNPSITLQTKHSAEFTFNKQSHNNPLSVCWAGAGKKCRREAGDSDDKSPVRTTCSWQYYILGLFHTRQG